MKPWFDDLPIDFSRHETRTAERLLASIYDERAKIRDLAMNAKVHLGAVPDFPATDQYLRAVLICARKANKLKRLLVEVLRDSTAGAIHLSIQDGVGKEGATLLRVEALSARPTIDLLTRFSLDLDVELEGEVQPEGFEKILFEKTGFDDPAVFRRELLLAELRTARIETSRGSGTGFLVGADLLLTAWHVVKDATPAGTALFDYKLASSGETVERCRVVHFSTDWNVVHSPCGSPLDEQSVDGPSPGRLDYCLVRLAEPVGAQEIGTERDASSPIRGHWELADAKDLTAGEQLRIIGFPRGGRMRLSISTPHTHVTNHRTRIRYSANTEGGSSGSPILNPRWTLVGLHHWAGPSGAKGSFNQGVPIQPIIRDIRARTTGQVLTDLRLPPVN